MFPDYTYISHGALDINGLEAISHSLTTTMVLDSQDTTIRIRRISVFRGTTLYEIDCLASLPLWEEYIVDFENVINSFFFTWTQEAFQQND